MSTTLPTDATKANCDSSADDPKLALTTDLAGLVDKFNLLKAALGGLAQMGVGNGLELEVSGGSVADLLRLAAKETSLAVTTTLTATHRGRFISCTATLTLNLTAAGTLGDGWFCFVRNAGSGTVTIDPSGSELVNGSATLALSAGESAILFCNGAAFKTVGYSPTLTSGQVDSAFGNIPGMTLQRGTLGWEAAPKSAVNNSANTTQNVTYYNNSNKDWVFTFAAVMSVNGSYSLVTVDGIGIVGTTVSAGEVSSVSGIIPPGSGYVLSASSGAYSSPTMILIY